MDIWIYGVGEWGLRLLNKTREYQDIHVIGVADSFVTGKWRNYDIVNLLADNHNVSPNSTIVIAIEKMKTVVQVGRRLQERGFNNLYFYLGKSKSFFTDFFQSECKKFPAPNVNVMPSLEMHVADYCNLNCAGCAHFSPLFTQKLPIFEKRIGDLYHIRRLFKHIMMLSLLGGEPLLNPELPRYMDEARNLFPEAEIQVITNGLMIPKVSNDFFKIAYDRKITIVVSEYQPTHSIIKQIITLLGSHQVEYTIRTFNKKQAFNRPLIIDKRVKHQKGCISDGCVSVCDGEIARCPTLLYLFRFNEVFATTLPLTGIYKIATQDNGEKLLTMLEQRVPLCDYCISDKIKWHICGHKPRIEDFALLE